MSQAGSVGREAGCVVSARMCESRERERPERVRNGERNYPAGNVERDRKGREPKLL